MKKNQLLRKTTIAICICLFLSSNTFAQPWVCQSRDNVLDDAERKPKLLLKSDETVKFKITTRKLELRKGDVLDLFYAYYNFAKTPVWIYDGIELRVDDEANKRLDIRSFVSHRNVGLVQSVSNFIPVDTQSYEAKHLQYFIGCEDATKTWENLSSSRKTNFENNKFYNTLIDCIDITNSKKIFVSLETENHGAVVVSPPKSKKNANVMPQFPTVTGNMKSNVLEISILEK